MNLLKNVLLAFVLGYPVIFMTVLLHDTFVKDMRQYKEDMKCINVLVSKGIERKDIISKDGVCIVDEDIYYNSSYN